MGLGLNIANALLERGGILLTSTAEAGGGVTFPSTPSRDERNSGCHPIAGKKARGILKLVTRQHGGKPHNAAINRRIVMLRVMQARYKFPYTQLTKHQRQKNAVGTAVSTCLPDLQYNFAGVFHYLEEYHTAMDALPTVNKMRVMQWADPLTGQLIFKVGGRK